jgi:hypothetical protein
MPAVTPRLSRRRLGDAFGDAWPDAIAAIACAIAWLRPDAFGFDLLRSAGLLFAIELPLAVITLFAIVRRIQDRHWSTAHKVGYVLMPTAILTVLGGAVVGPAGLIAIGWLGARTLLQFWRAPDADAADFCGMWLVSTREGNKLTTTWTATPPARVPKGTTVIPAGHEHLMAFATIVAWFAILVAMALLPEFGAAGATPDYARRVGWTDTALGDDVPAHLALAAGLMLFGIRTLLHFEGLDADAAPTPTVADDEVLRDIVEKIDGPQARAPRAKKRRR